MFFTRVGKVVAHLMFWIGAAGLMMGIVVAVGSPDMQTNMTLSNRYLGTENSGSRISTASQLLALGIALGVLCEISDRRQKRGADA